MRFLFAKVWYLTPLLLTHGVSAQGIITKTADVKGYGKRPRLNFESQLNISPSQLHEIYGAQIGGGISLRQTEIKSQGVKSDLQRPTYSFNGFWGGDQLVLGLAVGQAQTGIEVDGSDFSEDQSALKLEPKVAWTIADHITLGVASSSNWLEFKERTNDQSTKFEGYYHRESIGLSFHNEKMEFGFAFVGPVSTNMDAHKSRETAIGFGLVNIPEQNKRRVYIPGYATVYGRGNLTDQVSVIGSLSHVEYDKNIEQMADTFDQYRRDDRLAAKIGGVFWIKDRRTHFILTGRYTGATFIDEGLDSDGYGLRLANRTGATFNAVFALDKKSFVNAMVGYEEGEIDRSVNNISYRATERQRNFGLSLNKIF